MTDSISIRFAPSMVTHDDVTIYLAEKNTARVAAYVARGRRFETIEAADLQARWIAAFKAFAADPRSTERLRLADDLEDEMKIRRIEPPLEEVEAAADLFLGKVAAGYEALKADPAAFKEADDRMREDFDAAIRHAAESPKN